MNFVIVKSKAKGGFSAIEGEFRFSVSDALTQKMSYCASIGEAIILRKKPATFNLDRARFFHLMVLALEQKINDSKKVKE